MSGHPETVRILLDHGADPTMTDDRGRTPLDLARIESPFPYRQEAKDRVVAVLSKPALGEPTDASPRGHEYPRESSTGPMGRR
ncbi:MAG: ankyrin repeat domain-containing protein [Planctomycetes bacterium]|nr:ankyrin repeat domain-containing protein [Planctomycetota bacterium]